MSENKSWKGRRIASRPISAKELRIFMERVMKLCLGAVVANQRASNTH
jgi:hypothetical protein